MKTTLINSITASALLLALNACGNQPEMAVKGETSMKCGSDKTMQTGTKCGATQNKCQASGKCGK